MSVQSEINRISSNVTAALAAIADKGVTVPDGSNSDSLASLIAAIEAGGSGGGNFDFSSFFSNFECAASGSFTPSSDVKNVTCYHNLGVKPKLIYVCSPYAEILDNSSVRKTVSILAYQSREDITLGEERLYAHQATFGTGSTSASKTFGTANEYIVGNSSKNVVSSTLSDSYKYMNIYQNSSGYYNAVYNCGIEKFVLQPRNTNSYYKYFIAGATYYWFALA